MKNKTKTRRTKGTGSLQIKGRFWYARWTHNGIAHMESTGIRVGEERDGKTDRELANDYLMDRTEPLRIRHREDGIALLMRQLQSPSERLRAAIEEVQHRITVGELSAAFRNSPRRPDCKDDMLSFYCGVVDRFSRFVGTDIHAEDVDESVADRYAAAIGKDMAGETFNKAINALKLVWNILSREIQVPTERNPWAGIAKKRKDTHVRRPFTNDETDRILTAADGEMKTLIAVLLYTGLRLGDACQIKWEDVRGDAIYVITAKRDRKVGIPLHPILAALMGERKESGFVMPTIAARYACKQGSSNVSRSIKRIIENCGITTSYHVEGQRDRPDASAHSFRHTFVSRAIAVGIPPHIVQSIVGHASATMTERYTHLEDATILEAFKKIK